MTANSYAITITSAIVIENQFPQITRIARKLWECFLALSKAVIGCAIEVHKELGCGFLESVYENALSLEFHTNGLRFRRQAHIPVCYKGSRVGYSIVDMVVEDRLLLELKAVDRIATAHEAQLINYLCAARLQVGLILNFGARSLQIKRVLNGFGPGSRI